MRQIIESLTDPADHLALDESVLLAADAGELGETIRVWQFDRPVVVVGRSTKVNEEVDHAFCDQQAIPILRRCSGGASVVGGPGCLMYSIVISLDVHGELRKIDAAHRFVISRVLAATQQQISDVAWQGTCDLTYRNQKFSGNSLRISRSHLIYHGTILYDADLTLLAACLRNPPRQPDYRSGRDHHEFVTNVPIDPAALSADLYARFDVDEVPLNELPVHRMQQLRAERYDVSSWNHRH
ncbi:MAG: lipoate--protein ligase family protein [Pirellulaceae bacterium]|nr:lipoate--protein ligase family protein [Pirellulaceae bacterium]